MKLKGSMSRKVLTISWTRLIYSPGGMFRIARIFRIKQICRKGDIQIITWIIMNIGRILLNRLMNFAPAPAPREIPTSQLEKIIPRQSSLPKNTTMNSLIKSTCTTTAQQPNKVKARRVDIFWIFILFTVFKWPKVLMNIIFYIICIIVLDIWKEIW